MVVRRKKTVRRRSNKLMAKIKRDGVFKGTGDWAGSQVGGSIGKGIKKAVPAFMLLTAISAVTPPLGTTLANSQFVKRYSDSLAVSKYKCLLWPNVTRKTLKAINAR